MSYIVQHYIGGQLITEDTTSHAIYNPALGEVVGQVHFASKSLCDKAIATAKEAGIGWAQTPAIKRARILFKFRDLLEKTKWISHASSPANMVRL